MVQTNRRAVHGRTNQTLFALGCGVSIIFALSALPAHGALSALPAHGAALANQDSNEIFKDSAIEIHSSPLSSGEQLITVDFPKSHKQVSAIFSAGESQDRLWQKLWFSKGSALLSKSEQTELRASFDRSISTLKATDTTRSRSQADSDLARSQALVDFLANFLPADEKLQPFDRNVILPTGFLVQYRTIYALDRKYTMLCDSIGKVRTATVTDASANAFSKDVVVGAIDSNCRGRCGTACEQAGQWRHNQYTQECLNHDVCHDTTGSQLGPCENMFWKAAPGYVFAPDCTVKAIAIGPNIPVIIPTPPAGSGVSPAIPIPDPNPNDGSNITPAARAPIGSAPAPVLKD